MIFKRRERIPFWGRTREVLYPRKGIWRGIEYMKKRLHRLPDSPHRIALGLACGAFASFTPFFGFHFIVAAAIAWTVRGNLLASAFGTVVGNPVTFPIIAAASLEIGWWVLGREPDWPENGLSFGWLTKNLDDIFVPYVIGGLLPGFVAAVMVYFVLGPIIAAYQERRRKKLADRAERLRRAIEREQDAYTAHDGREGDNA